MASWAGGLPSRRGHYRLAGGRVKDALAAPLPRPGCARSLTRPFVRAGRQRRGKGSGSVCTCWGR